ncbi:hypothetical protein PV10_07215 [Exophiala mesophila]|uniref:CAP-Gly domain-containing protein n=1 Tax=Exophiala mesophila TaxID=212818 RepID=A0A0D1Z4W5_EXOME|nr:uncharacterized protein PV10_07215 [Exophiala mesophila]KIV89847.1 hypothetical protein PV10_07215 [Exophiala mesophila]
MSITRVGDSVMVPGDMHGVVKFIGPVAGKKGTFAGVQLSNEYAARGKNSGDVEGKYYFRTTIPGSGIFLPLEKAVKKPGSSGSSSGLGIRASPVPGTPTRLSSFNQGGRTPGIAKPSFSQSIGPGVRAGAASPALKPPTRRESLPRPTSPLRKANTPTPKALITPKTRGSGIGMAKSTNGALGQYTRPTSRPTNGFSQSLRQNSAAPAYSNGSPSLGPESSFDEMPENEADSTPTPTPNVSRSGDGDDLHYQGRIKLLTDELNDAKRQLREQNANFTEMERSFNELQKLLPDLEKTANGRRRNRGDDEDDEDLPRDVVTLRDLLREKNDKIKMLTSEFDNNRADFRSTIDTLEMASSETERVYEKRVDELLEEVRNLQDRSEDVETVAQQLKQLEELVQELEEGLEDARRGEAEARGEVEFLRGEVERSRSELRREKERIKTEEQLNGYSNNSANHNSGIQELESQLNAKDDEIRGLKAIIQNLNDSHNTSPKLNGNSTRNKDAHVESSSDDTRFDMQQQIRDLEALLQQKSLHEEELANEVKQLRNSVTLSRFPLPGNAFGMRTAAMSPPGGHSRDNSQDLAQKHLSAGSQRTVVLGSPKGKNMPQRQGSQREETWHDAAQSHGASPVKGPASRHLDYNAIIPGNHRNASHTDGSDDGVTDGSVSSATLWCEICEESGHDILTCSNMFGTGKASDSNHQSASGSGSLGRKGGREVLRDVKTLSTDHVRDSDNGDHMSLDRDRPAPLVSRRSNTSLPSASPSEAPNASLPPPPPGLSKSTSNDEPPTANGAANATSAASSAPIEGTGDQAGMLAGKSSGVIDPDKWCALCERDGHDSVDCPLEDAF